MEDHEELREEDFTLRTLENSEEQQPLNNNTQVKNSYNSIFKKKHSDFIVFRKTLIPLMKSKLLKSFPTFQHLKDQQI